MSAARVPTGGPPAPPSRVPGRPGSGQPELARPDRADRNLAVALASGITIAAIVTLVAFYSVPLSFSLVLHASGGPAPAEQNLTFPKGDRIWGTWATSGGLAVEFSLSSAGGGLVYSANGTSGQFALAAGDSTYLFRAVSPSGQPVTVWVNGSYEEGWP